MSWLLIRDLTVRRRRPYPNLWWQLATIISCGTLAAVLIPEFTKVFTSSHSKHVHEIVTASREGGASLTILSGIVAGNFSAFWKGMLIAGLMAVLRQPAGLNVCGQLTAIPRWSAIDQDAIKEAAVSSSRPAGSRRRGSGDCRRTWSASARSSPSAWWRSASCAWDR